MKFKGAAHSCNEATHLAFYIAMTQHARILLNLPRWQQSANTALSSCGCICLNPISNSSCHRQPTGSCHMKYKDSEEAGREGPHNCLLRHVHSLS